LTNDLRRLYLWVNITLTDDDIVVISGVESLINISSLITQQSPRTLQNYMIWRFIMFHPEHMPKQFRDAVFKFKAAIFGIKTKQSRAIVCAEYVNKNMGYAVSKLYRDKYFDKVAQNKVFIIIIDIKIICFILL
jgi:membrane metallo-endopeptidase-like protein 1